MNRRQKSAVTKFLFPVLTIGVVGAGIILNLTLTKTDTTTLTRAASQQEHKTTWLFAGNLDGWRTENVEIQSTTKPKVIELLIKPNRPNAALISHRINQPLSKGKPLINLNMSLNLLQNNQPKPFNPGEKVKLKLSYLTQQSQTWDDVKAVTLEYDPANPSSQPLIDLSDSPFMSDNNPNDSLTFLRLEPYLNPQLSADESVLLELVSLNLNFR